MTVLAALPALALTKPAVAQEAETKLEIATDSTAPPAQTSKEQENALTHGVAPRSDRDAGVDSEKAQAGRASGGAGVRGTFGRVLTEHVDDGWYGRLELEAFAAGSHRSAGPVGGALIGGEFWTAPDAGGGGLPMSFFLGYRTPGIFFTMGLGFDLFIVDRVDDDGGFGIYAPFGSSALGIELGGFRLLADARAIYRWQWGAPDRAQLQLGITMTQFIESPIASRRPNPRKRASKSQAW